MPRALLHIYQDFGETCCLHIVLWNWRQLVPSQCLWVSSRWHDVKCSKTVILTVSSVGTSDLTNEYLFCKMSTICHVYCENWKLPLWPDCSIDLMHVTGMCEEVWKTTLCHSKQLKHIGWTWGHHPACSLESFWTRFSGSRVFFSWCQSWL
jgi:hypothetical protein